VRKRFSPALAGLVCLVVSPSGWGDEPISHETLNRPVQIHIGIAAQSIQTDSSSLSTGSLSAAYRHPIQYGKFSWVTSAALLFKNTTSVLGLNANIGIGYRVFGQSRISEAYLDEGEIILKRSVESSGWTGIVDFAMNFLPVFGQYTTTTYAGPSLAFSVLKNRANPIGISVRYSTLSAGSKGLDAIELGVSYGFEL